MSIYGMMPLLCRLLQRSWWFKQTGRIHRFPKYLIYYSVHSGGEITFNLLPKEERQSLLMHAKTRQLCHNFNSASRSPFFFNPLIKCDLEIQFSGDLHQIIFWKREGLITMCWQLFCLNSDPPPPLGGLLHVDLVGSFVCMLAFRASFFAAQCFCLWDLRACEMVLVLLLQALTSLYSRNVYCSLKQTFLPIEAPS